MALRAFSSPLSVGIDICHVDRVRKILTKIDQDSSKLNRFLRRFLSLREQRDFYDRFGKDKPNAKNIDLISKHLAGRWSAKEAAIKAVTWRRLSFLDIHIGTLPDRRGVIAVILDQPAPTSSNIPHSLIDGDTSQPKQTHVPDFQITTPELSPLHIDKLSNLEKRNSKQEGTTADTENEITTLSGHIARISISHDGDYATAVCLAEEESTSPDDIYQTSTTSHQSSGLI